ncbi:MAG: tetratricopeptide repeat protein [Deltaproteobacteria bacterium]|nr:tetratricopeptide repeat protein [Deltaproteobacteria bacterium]
MAALAAIAVGFATIVASALVVPGARAAQPLSPQEQARRLQLADDAIDSARTLLARDEKRAAAQRLEEAEGLYKGILDGNPGQKDAAVGLSDVYYLTKRYEEGVKLLTPLHDREPDDHDVAHQLGLHLYRKGEASLAVPLLEQVAADDGRFDAAWLLAVHYYRQAEWEKGLPHAERYMRARPDDTRALALIGTYYLKTDRFTDAVDALDRYLAEFPDNLSARINRANALFRMGDYARAGMAYETLVTQNPDRARLLYNLAAVRIKQDRCDDAIPLLDRFIEKTKNDASARYFRADCLMRLGRLKEARAAFEDASLDQANNPWIEYSLSKIDFAEGKTESALSHVRKAMSIAPTEWEIASWLGTLLRRTGDPKQALTWHDKALELAPDDPTKQAGVASVHVERGRDLWALDRTEDALAAFERGRELDPESSEARLGAAAAQTRLALAVRAADPAAAKARLDAALALMPSYAAARTNLALLALDSGDTAEAERVIEGAPEPSLGPDHAAVLAYVRLLKDDAAGAETALKTARAAGKGGVAPGLAGLVREVEAHLAARRGDWQAAADAFEAAYAASPRDSLDRARARARAWLEVGLERLARGDAGAAKAALAKAAGQRATFAADDRATLDFATAALAVVAGGDTGPATRALQTLLGSATYRGPRWSNVREVGQVYVAYGHLQADDPDKALALLERVGEGGAVGAAAARMTRYAKDLIARRAYAAGKFTAAELIWRELATKDPSDGAAATNAAAAVFMAGQPDAAEAAWRKLTAAGGPPEAFFDLGVALDRKGQPRAAYDALRSYVGLGGQAGDAPERVKAKERVFGFGGRL